MGAPSSLITALEQYAEESNENLQALKTARDCALESIVSGNGAQMVSGTANGLSFNLSQSGLTNTEWFEAVQMVITKVEKYAGRKRGVTRARFF